MPATFLRGFLEEGSLEPVLEKQRHGVAALEGPLPGAFQRRFIPRRKGEPVRHRSVNQTELHTDEEAETRHRRIVVLGFTNTPSTSSGQNGVIPMIRDRYLSYRDSKMKPVLHTTKDTTPHTDDIGRRTCFTHQPCC
jgi:hypothetical protein